MSHCRAHNSPMCSLLGSQSQAFTLRAYVIWGSTTPTSSPTSPLLTPAVILAAFPKPGTCQALAHHWNSLIFRVLRLLLPSFQLLLQGHLIWEALPDHTMRDSNTAPSHAALHPALTGPCFLCYMSNHPAHWMFSWLFSVSRHKNVSSMRAGTSCYSATSPGAGVWKEFSKYSLNIHGMKVRTKGRMPLSSYCPTTS